MDKTKMKSHLPTIPKFLEKRRKAKANQLPKHLRPLSHVPLWIQIVLNCGLVVALYNVIVSRDDYFSEAGPAVVLVVCLLLLIYTLITALQLRHTYEHTPGRRLAKINFGLMIFAFLFWAVSIVVFIS